MKKNKSKYSVLFILVFMSLASINAFGQVQGSERPIQERGERQDTILTVKPEVTDSAIIAVPDQSSQSKMPTVAPEDVPKQDPNSSGVQKKSTGSKATKKTKTYKKESATIKSAKSSPEER